MPLEPHIDRSDYDGLTALRPVGEFDVAAGDQLRSAFAEAITATRHRIVVDLSATTFLDPSALDAIIWAGERASGWGGWVRLVAPPAHVLAILRTREIDTALGLYDTIEQALIRPDKG